MKEQLFDRLGNPRLRTGPNPIAEEQTENGSRNLGNLVRTWLKKGKDEYLSWLHEEYIPRALQRPGYLWACHQQNIMTPEREAQNLFPAWSTSTTPKWRTPESPAETSTCCCSARTRPTPS